MTKAQSIVLGATIGPIIAHYAFAFRKEWNLSKANEKTAYTLAMGVPVLIIMWAVGV